MLGLIIFAIGVPNKSIIVYFASRITAFLSSHTPTLDALFMENFNMIDAAGIEFFVITGFCSKIYKYQNKKNIQKGRWPAVLICFSLSLQKELQS